MATCYDRKNNQDLDLFACDDDGYTKSCCAPGQSCASNGLCVSADPDSLTPYYINGCTEQNWDDPICITECEWTGGNGVKPCGQGTYCCWGFADCDCNNATQVIALGPIRIVSTIPTNAKALLSTTSIATSSSTSTTYSISSSTLPLTFKAVTSTSSSTTTSNPTSPPPVDNSLPVGLGIGFGLGVPLLAVAAGLVWFFKRKQNSEPEEVTGLECKLEHYPPRLGRAEVDGSQLIVEMA